MKYLKGDTSCCLTGILSLQATKSVSAYQMGKVRAPTRKGLFDCRSFLALRTK